MHFPYLGVVLIDSFHSCGNLLFWVIDFHWICGVGSSHFHQISLPSVGWVGHHLVGGLLASHGASKLRRRARDSTSDIEAEILAKMERKMVSVAVLICCCCLYVRPVLATPGFMRQPSLVSSSANYVTQEVHWFSQRLDHFTSQVGQSVIHYSYIPFSLNSFSGFSHKLRNQLLLQLLPIRFTRCI